MDDLYSDTFGPFVTDGCHSSPVAILNRDLWLGCLKSLCLSKVHQLGFRWEMEPREIWDNHSPILD